MDEPFEKLFVNLKQWLVGLTPEPLQPWASILLSIVPLLAGFPLLFAVTTIIERKALGRIQNRLGPNRVGPYGFLQPIADGLKILTKEDIVPHTADKLVHFIAPIILVVPAFLALSVLPYGKHMVALDVEAGLLFFFAASASSEVAIFMAGWSSRNKYSLLGAMRAIAQMVSYELPLILSAVTVVMAVGSLRPVEIVAAQAHYTWGLPNWHLFTPWGLAGFVLFLIAATAESNRTPFDIPEGESEIIAGYLVEYSGFKFALFFLGEYLGLFAVSCLGITLFLGGWTAPVAFMSWVPSYVWFVSKLCVLLGFFIWLRGTLPRLRMDQLMAFAWKFMVPLTLINLLTAALWHFTKTWDYPGALLFRWLLCGGLVVIPYALLGKGLTQKRHAAARVYRFAD